MAVTPAPMSANQTAYLNGLVKAGGGNGEWAKAQLGAAPQAANPVAAVTSAPATPKPILGGLSQEQLTAMGEAIKGLGTNFGTAAPQTPKPQGTFNPAGYAGQIDLTKDNGGTQLPVPVAASNLTPAPMSQGSFPGQLNNDQIQAEVAARIAKQLAAAQTAATGALTGAKNAYDYSQKTTQGNRALLQFDNSNRGDQFGGSVREDNFRLSRQQGIEDTAQNNQYNAQVAQINQKLQDIQTAAPGDQQAMIDQLTKQERDYGVQVGQLTGTFNGQNTMQQNQNNFNNSIAQSGVTGQWTNPQTGQSQQTQQAQNQSFQQNLATNQDSRAAQGQNFNQNMQNQQFAYTQARDAIKDKQYQETFDRDMQKFGLDYALKQATLANQITNDQAQRSIGYMNAQTAQTNSSNSNSNMKQDNLMNIWKATGQAPAGIDGVREGTPYTGGSTSSQGNFNLDDYKGYIDKSFYKDEPVDPSKPWGAKQKVLDKAATRQYIIGLNLKDDQTDQMLKRYQLPTN